MRAATTQCEPAPRIREPSGKPLLWMMFAAALVTAFFGFLLLGCWQLQRMAWKHALIARVEARIHAEPVPAPGAKQWASFDSNHYSDHYEYRRVRLDGRFLDTKPARVQAVTELGPGWWILAAFQTTQGDVVLVNRGYVPSAAHAADPMPGTRSVFGLLRLDEPGGGFLRQNLPTQDRWYSRDVAAIAAARALGPVAPFFVDMDFDPAAAPWPRGGMTVVKFRDPHLQYALTWFALALMSAAAMVYWYRSERQLRRHDAQTAAKASAHDQQSGTDPAH